MGNNVLTRIDEGGLGWVVLNRPEIHNAFDDATIAELTAALEKMDRNAAVRVVILAANGPSFSAGADLNWMKRMARYSEAENRRDAMALGRLMRTLNDLSKPTIARVQGHAFAGGLGLITCCDMAVAARKAEFCVSEVKIGLIPAVISPYLIGAIGQHMARRYFLTAERFDAAEAYRIGLVHDIVEEEELDATVLALVRRVLAAGPAALTAAKRLITDVSNRPLDDALVAETAGRIAAIRVTPEGQEGLAAFFEKRAPRWTQTTAGANPAKKAAKKTPAARKAAGRK
jgi:methylglutaconyl-CoA hydratase